MAQWKVFKVHLKAETNDENVRLITCEWFASQDIFVGEIPGKFYGAEIWQNLPCSLNFYYNKGCVDLASPATTAHALHKGTEIALHITTKGTFLLNNILAFALRMKIYLFFKLKMLVNVFSKRSFPAFSCNNQSRSLGCVLLCEREWEWTETIGAWGKWDFCMKVTFCLFKYVTLNRF